MNTSGEDIVSFQILPAPNHSSDNISDSQYVPYGERLETYIVPAVFALIFLVGVVGNGSLIWIFVQNKRLRNVPNTYIMSLAVGDFIVIAGTVPFISTIYTFESWPYGQFICKLSEFLRDVSIGVTVLTLTLLSLDRYLAIVTPIKKHTGKNTRSKTVAMALAVWCLATTIAAPGAYYSFVWEVPVNSQKVIYVCYPFPDSMGKWYPKTMVLVKFLLLYLIPLLLIGSFYVLMALHLLMASRNTIGQNDTHMKQLRARTKVAKVVLVFVFIFAVCFFPNHVFMIWYYYNPEADNNYNDFWHVWKIMGYVLTFCNSCLNPIALYFISGVFRNYYQRYLCCCCIGKRKEKELIKSQGISFRSQSRFDSVTRNL